MDLKTLMKLVEEHWQFTNEEYPGYGALTPPRQQLFRLRHILLHQTKAVGYLAQVCEPVEHGQELNTEPLPQIARKFFHNALQLALAIGMTPEDLVGTTEPVAAPQP